MKNYVSVLLSNLLMLSPEEISIRLQRRFHYRSWHVLSNINPCPTLLLQQDYAFVAFVCLFVCLKEHIVHQICSIIQYIGLYIVHRVKHIILHLATLLKK